MTFQTESLTSPVSLCSKPSSGFTLPQAKTDGDLGPLESWKLSKAVLTAISNRGFFHIFIKLYPKAGGISALPLILEGTHFFLAFKTLIASPI